MVPEYAEVLSAVSTVLEPIGFKAIRDEEFLFVMKWSGCFVVLEGEPYIRGAFNLGITSAWPIKPDSVFSVRLLMKVLGDNSKPSLENQLRFLVTNMSTLFGPQDAYAARYRDLNEG